MVLSSTMFLSLQELVLSLVAGTVKTVGVTAVRIMLRVAFR
jgi:hypothetical protein